MKCLLEINSNLYGSSISFIDIDETTFHTYAKVGVHDREGNLVKKLDNQQFNTYDLQDGEHFNFDEFQDSDVFNKTSEPIEPIVKRIQNAVDSIKRNGMNDKVIFLTARSDYEKYGFDSPERKEYYHYLHNYEDDNFLDLYSWSKYASANYIEHKGKRRTFEEACQIAADKWCDLLFQWHLQDNGAINEDHGGGFYACALATVLKNEANKDITEEMITNTNKNLYEYYHNYCIYEDKYQISPYCDYDPNRPLYDILEKSGIPEKKIRNICPWKTGIDIDENDNAVVVKGYQKREYI